MDLSFSNLTEVIAVKYIEAEETSLVRDYLRELNDDDVVWDIGAHLGVHSCFFGTRAKKVVSIEPYPPNFRQLRRNLERNSVNAEAVPVALSDEDGTERMSDSGEDSPGDQWPALVPPSLAENRQRQLRHSETVEVQTKKGDTVVDDGVTPPTVVKIDVEGAAQKVLRGMRETLERDECRVVYIEVHLPIAGGQRPSVEDFGQTPAAIEQTLRTYGFDTRIISEREADFFLKGVK